MNRFTGKTVVVTGASSGIGAATARLFGAEGARVVLAARRRQEMEAVAATLPPGQTLIVPTDVTDLAAAAALLERAEAHFVAIHVLVNNAGISRRGPVEQRRVDDLLQMIDVNLRAPVALCRLVLPYLERAGGGAIVNVGSLAGRLAAAGGATYSATKFGLRAFSLALAEELKPRGITVSVVSPGPVDTEILHTGFDLLPDLYFSPAIMSAARAAELVVACACDGKRERSLPHSAATMTTVGSVFPALQRAARPLFEWLGRRHKRQYLRRKHP
jgi:short-subunit dehydrogenase